MLREDGRDQAPITGRLCAPTDILAVPPLVTCLCAGAARHLQRLAWAATAFTVSLFGIGLTARQPSGFVAPVMMAALEGWRWLPADVLSPDQTVLAGPDSPDVYFFTGRRNPMPVMFEMFVSPQDHAAMLCRLVESDDIGAVVFNLYPGFSEPWSEDVGRPLVHRMRRQTRIGKFIVYYDRAD